MNQKQAIATLKYYASKKREAHASSMNFMPDAHATAEIRDAKRVIDASTKTRAELVGQETARQMWREDE